MSDSGNDTDDSVGSNMAFSLHLCYNGVFQGLPLMQLGSYDRFLDMHASHQPPINTVQDFAAHFEDVMAMFEENDLGREYAGRSAQDSTRFPAVPERLSSAGIQRGLQAMNATITRLGHAVVEATVLRLWSDFGDVVEETAPAAVRAWREQDTELVFHLIGGFLEHARGTQCWPRRKICPTRNPVPKRGATVYRLLGQLRQA
jgi:hypothetical protein